MVPLVMTYDGAPAMARTSVVLPDPLGPTSAWMVPGLIRRLHPRRSGDELTETERFEIDNTARTRWVDFRCPYELKVYWAMV